MAKDFRETTLTVAGRTVVVRTELGRMKTQEALETAHTRAVKKALNEAQAARWDAYAAYRHLLT